MKILTRVLLWGFVFCFPVGANATEPHKSLEIGTGLVCNSAQQVERYLTLHSNNRSPDAAIAVVNTEAHDSNACMLAAIAFVRGEALGTVPAPGGVMRIVKVTIIAAQTPGGWARVDHLVQYTAIFEKLEEA